MVKNPKDDDVDLSVYNKSGIIYHDVFALSRHMHDIRAPSVTVLSDHLGTYDLERFSLCCTKKSGNQFEIKKKTTNTPRTNKPVFAASSNYTGYGEKVLNVYSSCEKWVNGETEFPFMDLLAEETTKQQKGKQTCHQILPHYRHLLCYDYFDILKHNLSLNRDPTKSVSKNEEKFFTGMQQAERLRYRSAQTTRRTKKTTEEDGDGDYSWEDDDSKVVRADGKIAATNRFEHDLVFTEESCKNMMTTQAFKEWNATSKADPITAIAASMFFAMCEMNNARKLELRFLMHGSLRIENNTAILAKVPYNTTLRMFLPGYLQSMDVYMDLYADCDFPMVDRHIRTLKYTANESYCDVKLSKYTHTAFKFCCPDEKYDLWSSAYAYNLFLYHPMPKQRPAYYSDVMSNIRPGLNWGYKAELPISVGFASCTAYDQLMLKLGIHEDYKIYKEIRPEKKARMYLKYVAAIAVLQYTLEFFNHPDFFNKNTVTQSDIIQFFKKLRVSPAFKIPNAYFRSENFTNCQPINQFRNTVPNMLKIVTYYVVEEILGIPCKDIHTGNLVTIEEAYDVIVSTRIENISVRPQVKQQRMAPFALLIYNEHFEFKLNSCDIPILFDHTSLPAPTTSNGIACRITEYIFKSIREFGMSDMHKNQSDIMNACKDVANGQANEIISNRRAAKILEESSNPTGDSRGCTGEPIEIDDDTIMYYVYLMAHADAGLCGKPVKSFPSELPKEFVFSGLTTAVLNPGLLFRVLTAEDTEFRLSHLLFTEEERKGKTPFDVHWRYCKYSETMPVLDFNSPGFGDKIAIKFAVADMGLVLLDPANDRPQLYLGCTFQEFTNKELESVQIENESPTVVASKSIDSPDVVASAVSAYRHMDMHIQDTDVYALFDPKNLEVSINDRVNFFRESVFQRIGVFESTLKKPEKQISATAISIINKRLYKSGPSSVTDHKHFDYSDDTVAAYIYARAKADGQNMMAAKHDDKKMKAVDVIPKMLESRTFTFTGVFYEHLTTSDITLVIKHDYSGFFYEESRYDKSTQDIITTRRQISPGVVAITNLTDFNWCPSAGATEFTVRWKYNADQKADEVPTMDLLSSRVSFPAANNKQFDIAIEDGRLVLTGPSSQKGGSRLSGHAATALFGGLFVVFCAFMPR